MNQTSGSKGGHWTGCLHFYNPKKEWEPLRSDQVINYFQNELKGEKEIITFAEIRKFNLSNVILGFCGVWHEYTLVKTTNYYWSFEKNMVGIFVQRSEHRDKVRLYLGDEKRKNDDRTEGRSSHVPHGENIVNAVEWIINRRALDRTYHFTKSNCHFFASLFYEAITKTKGRSLDNTN